MCNRQTIDEGHEKIVNVSNDVAAGASGFAEDVKLPL